MRGEKGRRSKGERGETELGWRGCDEVRGMNCVGRGQGSEGKLIGVRGGSDESEGRGKRE